MLLATIGMQGVSIAHRWRLSLFVLGVLALVALTRAQVSCSARDSTPRAPDVPYDPSPPHVVTAMLELANVRSDDVVYDLGCGDGRIVIAAVKQYGARGVCIDIDPRRIRESRANAEREGVSGSIRFVQQDLFEADISGASVVTLFLWPSVNLRLRPKLLRELQPEARVVSHMHSMGDWQPAGQVQVQVRGRPRSIYLWKIPRAQTP